MAGTSLDIALVDYGAGNLTSVVKGLTAVGAAVRVVDRANDLGDPQAVVIPGVGHFSVTRTLDAPWKDAIRETIARKRPFLGICVGLQWMFEGSEEAPELDGFGVMPGRCFRLSGDVKVPHVGWNTLDLEHRTSRLLTGLSADACAYFTHSYAAPLGPDSVATTTHGVPFASAVERDLAFGVQFHPEKSGSTGLRILANFISVVREAR